MTKTSLFLVLLLVAGTPPLSSDACDAAVLKVGLIAELRERSVPCSPARCRHAAPFRPCRPIWPRSESV